MTEAQRAIRQSPALVAGIVALLALVLGVTAFVGFILYIRLGTPLDFAPVDAIERDPTIVLLDRSGGKLATRLAPGPRITDLLQQAAAGNAGARNVIDAVVAMEDRNFWSSDGVRVTSLAKAMLVDGRGGSTIPMQVIKNVYWRPDRPLRDPLTGEDRQLVETRGQRAIRKFQEILFSPDLETRYSREQLLGIYFRLAPDYGAQARGIERVSLLFYGVYPEDLTAAQAATLAATLRATTGYDPRNIGVPGRQPHGRYAANRPMASAAACDAGDGGVRNNRCRALRVLEAMARQSESGPGAVAGRPMLSADEFAAARRELLTLGTCDAPRYMAQQRAMGLVPPDEQRCRRTPRQFIDVVMDKVAAGGFTARPGLVLEVATTFERQAHLAMVDTMEALRSCRFAPSEIGMASFTRNGELLATIEVPAQGLGDEDTDGYFGIPPGSTLKPFVYAAFLEANPDSDPETLIDDSNNYPITATTPGNWVMRRNGQPWWPNRNDPAAVLPLRSAMARSLNRAAVRLGATIGPDAINATFATAGVQFFGRVGSGDTTPPHGFPTTVNNNWPMAVIGEGGAARVRPLELIAAYTGFANNGIVSLPQVVTRVTYVAPDGRRRIGAEPPSRQRRLVSPRTAAMVDGMLAEVVSTGTASGLSLAASGVRGKTGTNSLNRYGWFIGYRPDNQRVTGVWLNAPAVTTSARNQERLKVSGRDAARIAARIIDGPAAGLEDICPDTSRELERRIAERLRTAKEAL